MLPFALVPYISFIRSCAQTSTTFFFIYQLETLDSIERRDSRLIYDDKFVSRLYCLAHQCKVACRFCIGYTSPMSSINSIQLLPSDIQTVNIPIRRIIRAFRHWIDFSASISKHIHRHLLRWARSIADPSRDKSIINKKKIFITTFSLNFWGTSFCTALSLLMCFFYATLS